MSREIQVEVQVGAGIIEIAPGWTAQAEIDDPYENVEPGETADHEARHAVAGAEDGILPKLASRIPGPGYLGKTEFPLFSAAAAMAPDAHGCNGTGYDVALVRAMGQDPGAAAAAARSLLSGKEEIIHAVAALIEVKGTAYGHEISEAMFSAANPRVNVEITDPSGQSSRYSERLKGSSNIIPISIPARLEKVA